MVYILVDNEKQHIESERHGEISYMVFSVQHIVKCILWLCVYTIHLTQQIESSRLLFTIYQWDMDNTPATTKIIESLKIDMLLPRCARIVSISAMNLNRRHYSSTSVYNYSNRWINIWHLYSVYIIYRDIPSQWN